MANNDDDNTDTVIAVGAIGGGAFLLWYLLRRRDRGLGGGGNTGGGEGAPAVAAPADVRAPVGPPCNVFMRGTAIELNGAASDLASAVAACRAVGSANVRATGDTTQGRVFEVARALNGAGVAILAHTDIADAVRDALLRAA